MTDQNPTDEEKILFWMREAKEARFALQDAVKAEREACAKVCENAEPPLGKPMQYLAAKAFGAKVAAAIRARSET